jgi:CheY-like chemotaxis protein
MMVVGLLGSTVEGQSAEVHVDIDPDVPQRCIGDGGRVQQVLRNLLSNAVKFTPDGEIRISLSQTGKENGQARLCFSVADTGVGIAEEEIGRLFESFYQVDSSYSKDFKGAGLGLSICKHLVELMNGEIGVQSVPGEGSTFWFEIPCGIDPEHAAPPSADQAADQPLGARQHVDSSASPGDRDASDAHVLIAEDNAINRFYLEQLVKGFGCSVTAVPDGESVVRALEHASYDIILMDIQMPGMDGIETTREVRKRSDVPVVALTAYARESEIQSFLNAGMNAAVTKPVNEDELLRVILEQVGAGAG